MFGKHIAYLRQHISNSNCVKQPLLVNKNMENKSTFSDDDMVREKQGRVGACVNSKIGKQCTMGFAL